MHDDKYLVVYSFLPHGSPISFDIQKEWKLPEGLLYGFFLLL